MASTRNRNDPGDYAQECRRYTQHANSCYGAPVVATVYHPGSGLIGHRCPATQLADNAVDVESMLRGIGATNLVTPTLPVEAHTRILPTWEFRERPVLVMPEPLQGAQGARPGLWTAQ